MANKLKEMEYSSVDLVRAGANQAADILLYKNEDGTPGTPESETGIFKRFLNWLKAQPEETQAAVEKAEPVEKDFVTFDDVNGSRENQEKLWQYNEAFTTSIRSIREDRELDAGAKAEMMRTSLRQYSEAMDRLIDVLCGSAPAAAPAMACTVGKSKKEEYDEIEEV